MLRALGEDAESLRQKYPEDIDDLLLFLELQKRRDVVFISTDTSQWTREHEARALRDSGVTALYFGPFFLKLGLWAQAVWLIGKWQKIKGYAEGAVTGTLAEIKQNGRAQEYRP
jgi:hypothetical protein